MLGIETRNRLFRVYFENKMFPVQGMFWDEDSIVEIRIVDNGYTKAIRGEKLLTVDLMSFTGIYSSDGKPVFEGDLVSFDYQRGSAEGVVRWCPIKKICIVDPTGGKRPTNQSHFKLSGKQNISIKGNVCEIYPSEKYGDKEE